MIVAGKAEEARAYFEERKATSVPVYRQTLRYHWTQTGMCMLCFYSFLFFGKIFGGVCERASASLHPITSTHRHNQRRS